MHVDRALILHTLDRNDVYLHTDEALMPHLKKTWSSWNFLGASAGAAASESAAVCVTYWLNKLQVRSNNTSPPLRCCRAADAATLLMLPRC